MNAYEDSAVISICRREPRERECGISRIVRESPQRVAAAYDHHGR